MYNELVHNVEEYRMDESPQAANGVDDTCTVDREYGIVSLSAMPVTMRAFKAVSRIGCNRISQSPNITEGSL